MACLFVILLVTVLVDGASSTVYCKFTKYDADKLTTTYYTKRCSDSCSDTLNSCGYNSHTSDLMYKYDQIIRYSRNFRKKWNIRYSSYTSTAGYRYYQPKSYRNSSLKLIIGLISTVFSIVLGVALYCCRKCRAKKASHRQIIFTTTPNTRMHDINDFGTTPSYPLLAVNRTGEPRNDFIASPRMQR